MRLVAAAAAFLLGTATALALGLGPGLKIPEAAFYLLLAASIVGVAGALLARRHVGVGLLVVIALLGMWRGGHAASIDTDAGWHGAPETQAVVTVVGELLADPAPSSFNTRLRLDVVAVIAEGERKDASFKLDVFADRLAATERGMAGRQVNGFRYGDRYIVTGPFEPSRGTGGPVAGRIASSTVILVGDDAGNPVRRWLASARQTIAASIERSASGAGSDLGVALTTGLRAGLDRQLTENFRAAGTAHVLAISGLHIALVGGLAFGIAAFSFGRRRQLYLLLPLAAVWGYAALAGFSPSVTRAAIMASAYLLARAMGRQRSALPAVGLAAGLMVAVDPAILASVSFQLSFAAVTGIALLATPLHDLFHRGIEKATGTESRSNLVVSPIVAMVAMSIAATIATAPLVAFYFGRVPTWSVPATTFVLPVLPLTVVLGAMTGLAGLINDQLGVVLGWPLWIAGSYMSGVSRLFASLGPDLFESGAWSSPAAIAYYLCVAAFLARKRISSAMSSFREQVTSTHGRARLPTPPLRLAVVAVSLATTGLGVAVTSSPPDLLRVTFFDIDRGHMTLIETPAGNRVLIDGGRDAEEAVRKLESHLPFWDRSLDLVLLTHPDVDHVGGLQAVLERFDVDLLIESPVEHQSQTYAAWRNIADEHPNRTVADPGQVVALDHGVALHVLLARRDGPDLSINDASVVTRLTYGDVSMLLPGDISRFSEYTLLESGLELRSTVLQVPHHGSDSSSTDAFLQSVDPAFAVVQVGSRNPFGHPSQQVMSRLSETVPEQQVMVTREVGTVTLESDGERLWVLTAD